MDKRPANGRERSRKRAEVDAHSPGRWHSEDDLVRGLTALAMSGDSPTKAAEALEAAGYPIPRTTLTRWRDEHVERFAAIRERLAPEVQRRIAATCEDTAVRIGEVERALIDRLKASIGALRPAEAAGALRNATVAKAVNVDKSALLRGQPTAIVEQRDPAEIMQALRSLGVQVVDSTAEELPDGAEVLELREPGELPPAA